MLPAGLESSLNWAEYNTADFGAEISLVWDERLPKCVVLKEAGTLACLKPNGDDGTLTALPAGYIHLGRTLAIKASQTVGIVVYW